jgi:hypothetical protein
MVGNRGPQKGTLIYYVFDLLKLGEVNLRGEPLRKRKEKLKRVLKGQQRLLYVDDMEREGFAMFAKSVVEFQTRTVLPSTPVSGTDAIALPPPTSQ